MNWLAQALLDSAGFVASCFITRDAPQFGLMQGAVALVLLVSIVTVLAFWPAQWGPFLSISFTKDAKWIGRTKGKRFTKYSGYEESRSLLGANNTIIVVCAVMFAIAAKYL